MDVQVSGISVTTRYVVFSDQSKGGITDNHPVPGDLRTIPPDRDLPLIVGDVVLFIAGHSSSAEEAGGIAVPLLAQATLNRPVTIIAMDLPSNGYASMIEHEEVAPSSASKWNTGYPILAFYENFIVAFVDGLEARQPAIKNQIVGVIGGSLGGNMGLRLARRDPATHPWLRNVVSWSPASCWESWIRDIGDELNIIRAGDAKKISVDQSFGFMQEPENPQQSLHNLFHGKKLGQSYGRVKQSEHWYSTNFACKDAFINGGHRLLYEIYNESFRRWHWRVGHEQLIYSHWDSDLAVTWPEGDPAGASLAADPDPRKNSSAPSARYSQIRARMLFASGYNDNNWPEYLFNNAKDLANAMTTVNGVALFVMDTAHSIHAERPKWFASQILEFLYQSPPPPFPAWFVAATF
jgi:pimeloyl-ACP methyl ester carboxylesterase